MSLLIVFLSSSCVTENAKTESPATLTAEERFHRATELATNWQFEEAVNEMEKAIEAVRNNPEYHMMPGSYKGRSGDSDAVLRGLEKALELDPANPRYYNNRAVYYMKEGMYDKALRDVNVHHFYVLDAYEAILRYASSNVSNLAHPDPPERATEDSPVLLIRKLQPIGIEPELALIVTNALHNGMLESGRYRIIDEDSRKTALEGIKTSLSGLTSGEADLKLGRLLEAEYILAGSASKVEGEFICNIVVSHTETALILFSKFLFALNMKELNDILRQTAGSL